MAPIPSRLPEETLSLISAAERRYKHLNEVQVPQLHKCIGPLTLQQTLAEDLRETTVALTRQIEELDMMVDDQQGEKNRRELRGIVNDFQKKLDSLRKDIRAALLTSKRAIDSRSKSNKEELLAFSSMEEKQTSSEKTTEDALMKTNSDVTDALRRTIAVMQSELERSVLTTQMLDDSTATLRSTSFQHDVLTGVMSSSKQLITALEKSDWLDRVLILSGFVFFLLVVLFILKQRILDRSLRIAFWWTQFLPSFNDDEALLTSAEKGMASGVVLSASAILSSLAATLASSVAVPIASPSSTLDIPESSSVISETLEPSSTFAESTIAVGKEAPSVTQHRPPYSLPVETPVHVEL